MIDNFADIRNLDEYIPEKVTLHFKHWLKETIKNNVEKSGKVGWEFRTKDDVYQVVCEFRKNDDSDWWVDDD